MDSDKPYNLRIAMACTGSAPLTLPHGPSIVDGLDWIKYPSDLVGNIEQNIKFPTYLDEKNLYFRYTSLLAYYETSSKNLFRNR